MAESILLQMASRSWFTLSRLALPGCWGWITSSPPHPGNSCTSHEAAAPSDTATDNLGACSNLAVNFVFCKRTVWHIGYHVIGLEGIDIVTRQHGFLECYVAT